MLVKPSHGLIEGLLLCKFLYLDTGITTDCKAMLYTTEQVDLPGLFCFCEDDFGLVTQFDGEDTICLGGTDAEGAFDSS